MKTKILINIALITFLFMNAFAVLVMADVSAEPHAADAVWVEPSSIVFTNSNASVGTKFNVTVWLNMTEKVFNYQVALYYNRTQLMCTRGGFTGVTRSNFMTGHSTNAIGPQIDTSYLGNGSVLATETCLGPDFAPGPNVGSLLWLEFQIMIVPASGNVTSTFDLSTTTANGDTWVSPDGGVTTYNVAPYDGAYAYVGPQGPPPPAGLSVSITPASSTIFEGGSVTFGSSVTGGIPPYTYQWYQNGTSVPSATSNTWIFTPPTSDFYTVYLNVTDNAAATATSNTATVTVTPPPGETRIYVDPPEIFNLTMGPSNTFNINVTLGNATNLGLCTFNLTYVPSVINWIGIEVFRVQGQFPTATIMLDGNAGFVWTSLNYSSPISTDPPAPIVRMTFHVEAYGISPLNLTDTQLLDYEGHTIAHAEFDGLFSNIIRDVAVTNVVPATNWIYQGWLDDISVTVKNLGNVSETFTASVYYNSSLIGNVPIVNLAPNDETTATITWNTTGVPEGNYTITGVASTVPFEYNTTNNVYVDGIVQVVTVIHDVAITNVSLSKTWIYQTQKVNISVTAINLGNVSESFNVSAFMDANLVGTTPLMDLAPNAQVTLTFTWNTTLATPWGNYTARGEASLVPHEYNATNNIYVDSVLTVRLLGDINGDGKVDGKDLGAVAQAFASYGPDYQYPGSPPHPRWDPNADLNGDNKVDGKDLGIVASRFGTF